MTILVKQVPVKKVLVKLILTTNFLIISGCTHVPLPATEKPDNRKVTLAKPVRLTADVTPLKNDLLRLQKELQLTSNKLSSNSLLPSLLNKASTHKMVVGTLVATATTVDAIELSLQANTKSQQKKTINTEELLRTGIHLLENGEVAAATKEFEQVLKHKPQDETALFMLRQVELTPQQFFDENSFNSRYQTQEGDTFVSIANQFLDDSLSFHSLVKLNQRKNIHDLKAGDIVLVPIAQLQKIKSKSKVTAQHKSAVGLPIKAKLIKDASVAVIETPRPKTAIQLEAALVQLKADRFYRSGMNALRNGKQYDAFKAFEKTLTLQPKNDMAALQLNKLKPTVTQFLHDKAMALYKNQKIKAAIGNWDRVLMIDTEHELAKTYRGRAIELQERLDQLPKNI